MAIKARRALKETQVPRNVPEVNAFLQLWVPQIMKSPAYKNGLIFITFDEGSDSAACCGETLGKSASHPNVAKPGMDGPGGSQPSPRPAIDGDRGRLHHLITTR